MTSNGFAPAASAVASEASHAQPHRTSSRSRRSRGRPTRSRKLERRPSHGAVGRGGGLGYAAVDAGRHYDLGMKRAEREALLRQGVTVPETPRDRRNLAGLAEDLRDNPASGRELPLRLRNFRPSTDAYLASLGGPRAYMIRLRRIDDLIGSHGDAARFVWHELAVECVDDRVFELEWTRVAEAWDFDDVNDLIDRHNRWYPVESRLPMDPARRDYALVNGKDYRRVELDTAWLLEQFPSRRDAAAASLRRSETHARVS